MDTVSGSGVIPESQLAGRGARLLAVILDAVIGGCLGAVLAIGGAAGAGDGGEPNVAVLAIGGLLIAAYVVWQIWMLVADGQTIGKKLMSIRIVKLDTGLNGGFVTNFLLRALVGQGLLGIIPFYGLVDALFIFRDDRRCIHDMVAGTTVVRAGSSAV